jgi:signal transduction histidine kinase
VPSRDTRARAAAPAGGGESGSRPASPPPAENAAPTQPAPAAKVSRRTLKNWRVRSRLLLLIIIPTLTAVVLGGTYVVNAVQNYLADQRVQALANLSSSVTSLANDLEGERDETMFYIGAGLSGRAGYQAHSTTIDQTYDPAANYQLVTQDQTYTDQWIRTVRQQSAAIGSGYPAQVQFEARDTLQLLDLLPQLRNASVNTQLPVLIVMQKYTAVIDQLLSIDDNIALDSGDPTLSNDVRALNLVSLIGEQASEQRGLLDYAFAQAAVSQTVKFNPQVLAAAQTAVEQENANLAEYDRVATPQQVSLYTNTVAGELVDYASSYESQAIQYGEDGISLAKSATTEGEWSGAMTTGTIDGIETVQGDLVADTIARASALRQHAILTASLVFAAVLAVLLLALVLTTVVGRSMVRPLRRLRSGALEVAGVRLPETVRRMSESDGAGVPLEVEPIDVDSMDEIGEVARAFDQVHREALRLAANEAALRGNVNAMFVNLSRRSQSLVERQIRLIDDLEQGEQDPDRLASLFQMDHLATRMRRNSENLLVLAGHDASRRWNQPVALVDVLRAAVSEIEQYERVTLNVQPGIAVRGHAVNDVVHLLAELAENATSFSSAETPVVIAGHLLSSGGVLLDITDQGVGMGAEEMAHANWRLDNPPVVDVAVSRRMGLFVVARLAARHGIRVRLRPAAAGGLTALVWLPDEVISHESTTGAPGMRRFDPVAVGGSALALPSGANGGADDPAAAAEREIKAARAPKFASLQADPGAEAGLGPRRVPGAGPHPGNSGWGGAATTSPLPIIGADSMPDSDGADEAVSDGYSAAAYADTDGNGNGPAPAGTSSVDFSAAPPPQPMQLGQPTVVGGAGPLGGGTGPRPADGSLTGASASGVVVPPAEHVATENRLPIFEAVESDWFRRGRTGVSATGGWQTQQDFTVASSTASPSPGLSTGLSPGLSQPEPEISWTTPSDRGWEAAAAASEPTTGGTTTAGLPKRVPQANLVPGTAAPEVAAPVPARSAAATRERFASFQRGIREGRAAAAGDEEDSDEDDGSR